MEAEKIYMNQELKMQAALPRAKKQVAPASDEGDHDPDYENITLTRRNHDQPRSGDAPSATSQGAAQPRPPSDTAQVPQWLYKAIMSLYILLALAFLLCIVLSALVLVKYSEMSEELKDLRTQLWNVSSWTQRCQEQQQTGWSNVERLLHEVANSIQGVANKVQAGSEKLKTEITQINKNIQKIFEKLEKKENPCKRGPWEVDEGGAVGRTVPDVGSVPCPPEPWLQQARRHYHHSLEDGEAPAREDGKRPRPQSV